VEFLSSRRTQTPSRKESVCRAVVTKVSAKFAQKIIVSIANDSPTQLPGTPRSERRAPVSFFWETKITYKRKLGTSAYRRCLIRDMSVRLRILLPLIMSIGSLPLALWEVHNERVIEAMGMGWDTGAPIWPFQTSDILLRLLNGPAYYVSMPLTNGLKLFGGNQFVIVFPAIVFWWWFVGLQFDYGFVVSKSRWWFLASGLLVIASVLLLTMATSISVDRMRWWFTYTEGFSRPDALLTMTRFLTPSLWLALVALFALVMAKRGRWRTD
jgi:hypothetical protein